MDAMIREQRFGADAPADLRSRTAGGTIVNALFMAGVSSVWLLQSVLVARLLPLHAVGEWGLLMASFLTLLALGSVGINDKYVQQDEPDQQRAFEVAFTIQMLLGAVFVVVILAGMPLFALIYGRPELIGPGCAMALAIPVLAFQMPMWTHYRRMDFLRQRTLQAIDPLATFAVTITLVLAGLEVWALVIGAITGSALATVAIVRSSPYPLRLRWDRAALREYTRFSWPLLAAALGTMLVVQVPVTVSARVLDVAAVAAISLAGNLAQFTTRLDTLVTQSLYPAICAVKDRTDLLFESFWKSNRLALLWAAPLGTAVALFARDFVHWVIGDKWHYAVPLIAIAALSAVVNQIGFNWSAFFRALDDTRPMAVASAVGVVVTLAVGIPLLVTDGVTGFGVGVAAAAVAGVALRVWYLRRLFPQMEIVKHVARGIGPTLPAAVAVLALRQLESGPRSGGVVIAELAVYALLAVAVTFASERALLREAVGYLRRARVRREPQLTRAAG